MVDTTATRVTALPLVPLNALMPWLTPPPRAANTPPPAPLASTVIHSGAREFSRTNHRGREATLIFF